MKSVTAKNWMFEFVSIFVAVISAFALSNWNEKRKDKITEASILQEISNGLNKDTTDMRFNMIGHQQGIAACKYWRRLVQGDTAFIDSLGIHYFNVTRSFVTLQNVSGYETLKSKGLELVRDESLRNQIISLYEYDYNGLRKLEEEYAELQFFENYFPSINKYIAPYLQFDQKGTVVGIEHPMPLTNAEKNTLLAELGRLQGNRIFMLHYYETVFQKVAALQLSLQNR